MNLAVLIVTGFAVLAVLGGVVLLVMGRGGEMARFEADYPPLDLPDDRPITSIDVGHVRLPISLWGYHVRAVDEVLYRLSGALSERDRRIAGLERRVAELGGVAPTWPETKGTLPLEPADESPFRADNEAPTPLDRDTGEDTGRSSVVNSGTNGQEPEADPRRKR